VSLKNRILLSIAWFILCIVIGTAAFAVMINNSPRRDRDARASMLGGGMGVLVSIGWAGLWLPYAAEIGKKRREERTRANRKAKKRR
jgi:hypothetical protein